MYIHIYIYTYTNLKTVLVIISAFLDTAWIGRGSGQLNYFLTCRDPYTCYTISYEIIRYYTILYCILHYFA